MYTYGVSVSVKQCRAFGIQPKDCMTWLAKDCGFKRFRLMSYWNEIEAEQGRYDFAELDRQIALAEKYDAEVSLCLGARQPRWPENHWPDWALTLTKEERTTALLLFIEKVVTRYKDKKHITGYQLENEALLKGFGLHSEIDRKRLREEFALVKELDPNTPIIMSTSNTWGIPLRRPIPDLVGFSYYQVHFSARRQRYHTAFHKPWLHRMRAWMIQLLWHRPSIIHELQLEPWGPKAIWEMPFKEQMRSMSPAQIKQNLSLAHQTQLKTIDLWGGEWWYWCTKEQHHPEIIETVTTALKTNGTTTRRSR